MFAFLKNRSRRQKALRGNNTVAAEVLEDRQLLAADLRARIGAVTFNDVGRTVVQNPNGVATVYAGNEFLVRPIIDGIANLDQKAGESFSVRIRAFGETRPAGPFTNASVNKMTFKFTAKPGDSEIRIEVIPHFKDPVSKNNTVSLPVVGLRSTATIRWMGVSEVVQPGYSNSSPESPARQTYDIMAANGALRSGDIFDTVLPNSRNPAGLKLKVEGNIWTTTFRPREVTISWKITGNGEELWGNGTLSKTETTDPSRVGQTAYRVGGTVNVAVPSLVGRYSLTIIAYVLDESGAQNVCLASTHSLYMLQNESIDSKTGLRDTWTPNALKTAVSYATAGPVATSVDRILTNLMTSVWNQKWKYDLSRAANPLPIGRLLFDTTTDKYATCVEYTAAWQMLASIHGINTASVSYRAGTFINHLNPDTAPLIVLGDRDNSISLVAPDGTVGNAKKATTANAAVDRWVFRNHTFGYSAATGKSYDPTFKQSEKFKPINHTIQNSSTTWLSNAPSYFYSELAHNGKSGVDSRWTTPAEVKPRMTFARTKDISANTPVGEYAYWIG